MAKKFEVEIVLKFEVEVEESEIDSAMMLLDSKDRAYAEVDAAYSKARELGLENYDDLDFSVTEVK